MAEEQVVEQWRMYRAVFYNFWYYPNQELIFQDGCAVLRGHNGSGKSVTTQCLITVLLDGDTRSSKLDPFGGRERKISDTVLGEEDLTGLTRRIGYMALEFRKGTSGLSKTIGMGIDANRERKQPKIWRFIMNGKTVGNGTGELPLFRLEKLEGERKEIPLNEKDLRNLLEQEQACGKVYANREEYASQVNKQLFGYETLEAFNGLIDLLLQIRSPRLSDQNKPEGAVEVLNDSLPQLTEGELSPLTSSIESIDRIEKDLQRFKMDLRAISRLNAVYLDYNKLALAEKADAFLKAKKQYSKTKQQLVALGKQTEKERQELGQAEMDLRKLENQWQVLKEEKASLGVAEIESVQEQLNTEQLQVQGSRKRLLYLEEKKDETNRLLREQQKMIERFEAEMDRKGKELHGYLMDLSAWSSEMDFEKHQPFFEHFKTHQDEEEYGFGAWLEAIKSYKAFIQETREKLIEHEQLGKQVADLKRSLGELEQKIYQSEQLIEQLENEYEAEVRKVRDQIEEWSFEAKVLALPETVKNQLQAQVDEVFDTLDKEVYLEPLNRHLQLKQQEWMLAIANLRSLVGQKEEVLAELSSEIAMWKADKELTPAFVERKSADWQKLTELGIDFQPFYEVFAFREHVTEEEQLWLQSAFYEAGLLSAVVVAPEDVARASEVTSVVHLQEAKHNNLSTVLQAEGTGLACEGLLEGISFETSETGYILCDGRFRTNFITGKAALYDANLFIGKAAREKNRLRRIAELEARYTEELLLKEQLLKEVAEAERANQQLGVERADFPAIASLAELMKQIDGEKGKIADVYRPERNQKSDLIQEIAQEMKRILMRIKHEVDFSTLSLTVVDFSEELHRIDDYQETFQEIRTVHKDLQYAKGQVANHALQVVQQTERVEELQEDMMDCQLKIEASEQKMVALEMRLKEMGSDEILARLQTLSNLIDREIPTKRDVLIAGRSLLSNNLTRLQEETNQLEQINLPFDQLLAEAWEKTFAEQIHLGLVQLAEGDVAQDLEDQARAVVQRYGSELDRNREAIEQVKARLNKRFQEQKVELLHYDLDLTVVPSEFTPVYETKDENQQRTLNFTREQMTRMVVTLSVRDSRVPVGTAVEHLSLKIDELEVLASEKDRELFQEILVNTLGDSIRRKVQYVENWEKQMNKYMEHKNLIKFRIKWVAKRSEKEGEMHTRSLVEALKRDSRWVDVEEISKHFRTKIEDAKRRFNRDNEVNLQQVMREILDYRTWFDFEIYFTKHGGKERRLNRNSYGELSGGQRVLAMITPVLAALYAKYMDGAKDAPRLFTLDEAFARVDDENINVMFAYIHKLGFNYILNSQGLWGCFESVPSLNIYELLRPNNIPYVAVQSYYWNGHKRVKLEHDMDGNAIDEEMEEVRG